MNFLGFLEEVKGELPHLATGSNNPIYNKEWIDGLELQNMVYLLEAAARSALWRKESRGVHYREDYPLTDNDNWLRESRARLLGEGFEITGAPATFTSLTPPSGAIPYLDRLKEMMEAHSEVGGHH